MTTFDDLAAQLHAELRALFRRYPSLDPAFRQAMAELAEDENTTIVAGYVGAPMGWSATWPEYAEVQDGS